MLKYVEPLDWLPTAEDLPDSDDTPVDNELQELVPTLLKQILSGIWDDQDEWFFGIDMGLYYSPDEPPVVPDGFISLGVEDVKDENLRLSYVLWEEKGILPQFVLEVVSKKYRGEYTTKKALYEQLGILYYAVYNSRRKRKPTLEIYKLIQGKYLPVVGNPAWMPELNLGLGKERLRHQRRDREWLFWYDQDGVRYPTPHEQTKQEIERAKEASERAKQASERAKEASERAKQESERAKQESERAKEASERAKQESERADRAQTRADQAESRSQQLADRLRALGIDPDEAV